MKATPRLLLGLPVRLLLGWPRMPELQSAALNSAPECAILGKLKRPTLTLISAIARKRCTGATILIINTGRGRIIDDGPLRISEASCWCWSSAPRKERRMGMTLELGLLEAACFGGVAVVQRSLVASRST
jgi:hypothetical protein